MSDQHDLTMFRPAAGLSARTQGVADAAVFATPPAPSVGEHGALPGCSTVAVR